MPRQMQTVLFICFAILVSCATRNFETKEKTKVFNSKDSQNLSAGDSKLNAAFLGLVKAYVEFLGSRNTMQLTQQWQADSKTRIIGPVPNFAYSPSFKIAPKLLLPKLMPVLPLDLQNELEGNSKLVDQVFAGAFRHYYSAIAPRDTYVKREGVSQAKEMMFFLPKFHSDRDVLVVFFSLLLGGVGEYGPALNRQMILTTSYLFDELFSKEFSAISSKFEKDFAEVSFFRKNDYGKGVEIEHSPAKRALAEGILTIYQSLLILAARQIEGYDSNKLILRLLQPLKLEDERANESLLSLFARVAPPGFIGPTISTGNFLNDVPLSENGSGVLRPSPELYQFFKKLKNECLERIGKGDLQEGLATTCMGCPLSRIYSGNEKLSAVQQIANEFLRVYEAMGEKAM